MFAPPQTIEVHDAEVDRRLDAEYDVPLALALEGGQKQGPTWGGRTLYVASATGARLRANTVAQIRNHRLSGLDTVIRTNSFGYRNPEIGLKERRRVLFLGDSITLGDWLPEAETFVRRVEALSARDEEPLETINAGVSAVGLATELAILVETGVRLDPDVVVLGFYLNDAEPSRGVHLLRVPRALAWSWLARHAWRLASLALARGESGAELPERDEQDAAWRHDLRALEHDKTRWRDEIRKRFPPGDGRPQESPAAFNRVILSRIDSWGRAWSTATWRSLEPLFFELKRQASIHDFELLIVGFPVRLQVEAKFVYDHPQQELRTIAETIEAPFLDLLPLLREAHRRESVPLFYDQGHHTSRGNAVIAAAILDFIRAEVPSSE
jgi:lysophospholipase L1-like esterase